MDENDLADLLKGLSLSTCPNLTCKDTKCFVCHERCSKCMRDCKCNKSLPDDRYIRQPGMFFHTYDKLDVYISKPDDVRLPDPIGSFQDLKELPPSIIDKSFYKKPTPVQKHAIPFMMAGLDLVACAQTGSGKTAAFLLPIFAKILSRSKNEGPYALILTPTRELAIQIYQDIKQLTKETSIKCCCVYGGTNVEKNRLDVNLGFDILVGTPGRVLHLLKLNKTLLSTIKILVLDEGDHILGSNFIFDLTEINELLPSKEERQTVLFCATLPEEVIDLRAAVNNKHRKSERIKFTQILEEFMNNFVFLCVGKVDGSSGLIDQRLIKVQQNLPKIKMLIDILVEEVKEKSKTIVFVETITETRSLSKFLCQCGFQVTVFHKDRSQTDREYGLHHFNSGIKPIMVCTSVSARGLDIDEVKTVINYDLPRDVSTYIYRIGRTGRAGNRGKSISFFVEGRDDQIARGLVKTLSVSEQDVPEWLEEIAEKCLGTEYGPRAGIFAAKDTRKKVSKQIYLNGPS